METKYCMNPEVLEKYKEKRQRVESFFVNENLLPGERISAMSPSGEYRLDIDEYGTKPTSWSYSRGVVRRVRDDAIMVDAKRNIGHFPYTWVQHHNGNEYLLCGEDYQGYSIINLTREITNTFFSAAAVQGVEFCWVDFYPSPDTCILAVEGCIWAWPYEVRFYDFSRPDELPLPELGRIENSDKVIGWEDAETFVASHEYPFRASDGKRYEDLSPEERTELDHDTTGSLEAYGMEAVRWKRPRTGATPDE